jgi:hypothetical protein
MMVPTSWAYWSSVLTAIYLMYVKHILVVGLVASCWFVGEKEIGKRKSIHYVAALIHPLSHKLLKI